MDSSISGGSEEELGTNSFWDGPHKSVWHGYEAFSSWLSHHRPLLIYIRKISVHTLRSARSHLGSILAKPAGPIVIILDSFKAHFHLWVSRKCTKVSFAFWWKQKACPNLAVYPQSWDKPDTSPAPKLPEVLSTRSAPTTTQAPVPALAFRERRYCLWRTAAGS